MFDIVNREPVFLNVLDITTRLLVPDELLGAARAYI
jgi:hypothetical protein